MEPLDQPDRLQSTAMDVEEPVTVMSMYDGVKRRRSVQQPDKGSSSPCARGKKSLERGAAGSKESLNKIKKGKITKSGSGKPGKKWSTKSKNGQKWDWPVPVDMTHMVVYYDETNEYGIELTDKVKKCCWMTRDQMRIGIIVHLIFDRAYRAKICAFYATREQCEQFINLQPITVARSPKIGRGRNVKKEKQKEEEEEKEEDESSDEEEEEGEKEKEEERIREKEEREEEESDEYEDSSDEEMTEAEEVERTIKIEEEEEERQVKIEEEERQVKIEEDECVESETIEECEERERREKEEERRTKKEREAEDQKNRLAAMLMREVEGKEERMRKIEEEKRKKKERDEEEMRRRKKDEEDERRVRERQDEERREMKRREAEERKLKKEKEEERMKEKERKKEEKRKEKIKVKEREEEEERRRREREELERKRREEEEAQDNGMMQDGMGYEEDLPDIDQIEAQNARDVEEMWRRTSLELRLTGVEHSIPPLSRMDTVDARGRSFASLTRESGAGRVGEPLGVRAAGRAGGGGGGGLANENRGGWYIPAHLVPIQPVRAAPAADRNASLQLPLAASDASSTVSNGSAASAASSSSSSGPVPLQPLRFPFAPRLDRPPPIAGLPPATPNNNGNVAFGNHRPINPITGLAQPPAHDQLFREQAAAPGNQWAQNNGDLLPSQQ